MHSLETRQKMSATHKARGTGKWNKGRKPYVMTDEVRAKMSATRKGWEPSEEVKRKISDTLKGKILGEKHPMWKGGVSRAYKTGYYSVEYKTWREAVFKRDDYTCTECGETGYLTAHHVKSFAQYPSLRFELENGKTLCEPCHSKTDNYKGRARRLGRVGQLLTKV